MPATVSHALSMTTPDDPAYENKPSNWNSVHAVSLNISATEISGLFSNANGVSFGMSADSITASHNALTSQSNQAFSANGGASAFQTLTFNDANGITWSNAAGAVQASYSQSTHTHRTDFRAITLGGNSAGTSTFNASNNDTIFLNGGNNITLSGNGSTITISAANQTNQSAIRALGVSNTGNTAGNTGVSTGIDWVIAGTNNITVSQSTAVGGPNTIWLSAPTPGAGGAVNVSAGTTSNDLTQVVFSNSNNLSFGLNGSTITGSFNAINVGVSTGGNTSGTTGTLEGAGGQYVFVGTNGVTLSQSINGSSGTVTISGAGATLSSLHVFGGIGWSSNTQNMAGSTSGNVSVWPFTITNWLSAGVMDIMLALSFTTLGTSSGRQTGGICVGLYTRNVSTLSSIYSTSFNWHVTGQNSSYTINQVTVTNYTGYGVTGATNSSGVNISSGYTGGKMVGFPINSLMSPGVYWLALMGTMSTSSINVGLSFQMQGGIIPAQQQLLAPIGSFSTAYSTGFNMVGGRFHNGGGVWSSAGSQTNVPVSMAFASISQSTAYSLSPMVRFWRT
jgi:hypothetical protein